LIKRVFQEIELLKTNGPTDKQVNDEKEALLREFETNSKLNNYLLSQITAKYQSGEDPASLWHISELYSKIDKAMIQQAARTYLNTNAYVEVMLFPEKK
jgi:zinc protease